MGLRIWGGILLCPDYARVILRGQACIIDEIKVVIPEDVVRNGKERQER